MSKQSTRKSTRSTENQNGSGKRPKLAAGMATPQSDRDPRKALKGGSKGPEKVPTKKARLIGLLQSEQGETIDALVKLLGWQAHTVREAMTGLRKAGFVIEGSKPEEGGPSCFRIVSQNDASKAVA